jgi:two-component system phosphate regulon response regulator OmpR
VFLPELGEQAPKVIETVLVVEDDIRIRKVIERILDTQGYRVILANDADEAVALARVNEVALIVSDVMLPGASGLEVIARVREISPRVQALLMSGYGDQRDLPPGVDSSARNFLQKPFSRTTLLARVRELLDTN